MISSHNQLQAAEHLPVPEKIVEATIAAYLAGYFPMSEDGELDYFTCDPRSLYLFDSFHVPRKLGRLYRQQPFEMRIDTAFERVVCNCRAGRPEWISEFQVQLYVELFERGYAHSIEAWQDGELAGAIFGTQFGAAFLAESMYHSVSHASNICIVYMMERLQLGGFHFCDIQYANEHTARFNPVNVGMVEFQERYQSAIAAEASL